MPWTHRISAIVTQWQLIQRRFSPVSAQWRTLCTAMSVHVHEAHAALQEVYCVALAIVLRCSICSLIRTPWDGVCSVLQKMRAVAWRCHCVAAALLAIALRLPRRSAFFSWERRPDVTGVLPCYHLGFFLFYFFYISWHIDRLSLVCSNHIKWQDYMQKLGHKNIKTGTIPSMFDWNYTGRYDLSKKKTDKSYISFLGF